MTDTTGDGHVVTDYAATQLNQYENMYADTDPPAGRWFEYDADGNLVNSPVAGDMNCDGVINGFDINGFMLAMEDCDDYYAQYPNCNCLHADVNGDGIINGFDLDTFIELFGGGSSIGLLQQKFTWDAENRLVTVEPAGTPEDGDKQVACTRPGTGLRCSE